MAGQRGSKRGLPAPLGAVLCATLALALGCAKAPSPSAPTAAVAAPRRSLAADREHLALTVYNNDFALVRERRRLSLGEGRVELAYEDVSAHVQPATVHLRSLDDQGLAVLEQNYRYDVLTPATLLRKYVGRRVTLVRDNPALGTEERRDAELLGIENGPVVRVDGEIVSNVSERFVFPELPPSLLERPTLVWLLDSARAEQRVEVTYLTSALSWRADYVLVLDDSAQRGDLSGWVTLDNRSGTSFVQAELQLVAGDVQRVLPPTPPPAPMPMDARAGGVVGSAANFARESLFEYHLYTLGRPADVLDREQKQIRLLEARGAKLEKKLVLRGVDGGWRAIWGAQPRLEHARVLVELDNSEQNQLGMPLPAGVVRVYAADAAGAQQFVGEHAIEHTPRDEPLELELGESFDVVAERRQSAWRALGRCSSESSWAIELRNHEDAAARVQLIEPGAGDYEVTRSSHPVREREAERFTFEVDVPARGRVTVTYELRARWC